MSTRNLVLLLIPLVLIAGLLLSIEPGKAPSMSEAASVSSGVIYDSGVEQTVLAFGAALKSVSVLAPADSVAAAMDASYGAYVAPELLSQWKADPSKAPGRQTSSPWPDRIQIAQMKESGGAFIVDGTVVEVANGTGGAEDVVGTYPVQLRLEKRGTSWLITSFEKGAYSQLPARKTIVGTFTCLPHRDTSGPQTMECAFGIREDGSGDHYAVSTQLLASTDWQNIPSGSHVRIDGVVTPIEMLSTDMWRKYDIVGIIGATTIRQI